MKLKLSWFALLGALLTPNANSEVVSYRLSGIFDVSPEIFVSDPNLQEDPDTTDWGFLPQLFGASFTLTFDIDEDSPRSGTSGGGQAAISNFNDAASNVTLQVAGNPFATAASGEVRQVLAQSSHTWALDAEGTLNGPPLELFDFFNGAPTGYTVDRPFLSLALIDSDKVAYSGSANSLIRLEESVFLGDAPVGFITDSLALFFSSEDGDVFVEYNISGTISSIQVVPLPAAAWLFISALGGLLITNSRRSV